MTLSIWDMAVISAWIVVWFVVLGTIFGIVGSAIRKRRKRVVALSAAASALADKLRQSVYTQEEFDEIVRMMKEKDDK
jgi:hypothetical protein